MAPVKQAEVLLNLFERLWKKKYGRKYQGNRAKDKWGIRDMIDDLGYDRAKQVIEYYFKLSNNNHNRVDLIYNYEEIVQAMDRRDRDREHRRQLLEQTKRTVEQYEQK